ncbi:MAG: bacteriohemerythrin [Terracidiphilus sp.]|jgi:hemerythrin
MALLTWNSKFSVGIQSIDDQHMVLFESLNDLHAAMMKGNAQAATKTLLRNLVAYTRDHFKSEEAMMSATHYPGLAGHRTKHNDLTKQVEDFAARYERGESSLNIQLLNFLRDWLTKHIQVEDHAYSPWIKEHGGR